MLITAKVQYYIVPGTTGSGARSARRIEVSKCGLQLAHLFHANKGFEYEFRNNTRDCRPPSSTIAPRHTPNWSMPTQLRYRHTQFWLREAPAGRVE